MGNFLDYLENKINTESKFENITKEKAEHIYRTLQLLNKTIETHKGTTFEKIFQYSPNKNLLYDRIIEELLSNIGNSETLKSEKIYNSIVSEMDYLLTITYEEKALNLVFINQSNNQNQSISTKYFSLFTDDDHYKSFKRYQLVLSNYENIVKEEFLEENKLKDIYTFFAKKNQDTENEITKTSIETIKVVENNIKKMNDNILSKIKEGKNSPLLETYEEEKEKLQNILTLKDKNQENNVIINQIKKEYLKDLYNSRVINAIVSEELLKEKDLKNKIKNKEEKLNKINETINKDSGIKDKILEKLLPNIENDELLNELKKDIIEKINVSAYIIGTKPFLKEEDIKANVEEKKEEVREDIEEKQIRLEKINGSFQDIKEINKEALVNMLIKELNNSKEKINQIELEQVIDILKDLENDTEKLEYLILKRKEQLEKKENKTKEEIEEIKLLTEFNDESEMTINLPKIIYMTIIKGLTERKNESEITFIQEFVDYFKKSETNREQTKNQILKDIEELDYKNLQEENFQNIIEYFKSINKKEEINFLIDLKNNTKGMDEEEIREEINKNKKNLKETIEEPNKKIKEEIKTQYINIKNKTKTHVLEITLSETNGKKDLEKYKKALEIKDGNLEEEINKIDEKMEDLKKETKFPICHYEILLDIIEKYGTNIYPEIDKIEKNKIFEIKTLILKRAISQTIMSHVITDKEIKEVNRLLLIDLNTLSDIQKEYISNIFEKVTTQEQKEKYFTIDNLLEKWEELRWEDIEKNQEKLSEQLLNGQKTLYKKELEGKDYINSNNIDFLKGFSEDLLAMKIKEKSKLRTLDNTIKMGINKSSKLIDENYIEINRNNKDYIKSSLNNLKDLTYKYKSSDVISSMFEKEQEIINFEKLNEIKKIDFLAEHLFAIISIDGKLFKDIKNQKYANNKKELVKYLMGTNIQEEEDIELQKLQVYLKRYVFSIYEVYKELEEDYNNLENKENLENNYSTKSKYIYSKVKKETILNLNEENYNKKLKYIEEINVKNPKSGNMLDILKSLEATKMGYSETNKNIQGYFNSYSRIIIFLSEIKLDKNKLEVILEKENPTEEELVSFFKEQTNGETILNLIPKSTLRDYIKLYKEKNPLPMEKIDDFFTGDNARKLQKEYTKEKEKRFEVKIYNLIENNKTKEKQEEVKQIFKNKIKYSLEKNKTKKSLQSPLQKSLINVYMENTSNDEITTKEIEKVFDNVLNDTMSVTNFPEDCKNLMDIWNKRIYELSKNNTISVETYYTEFRKLVNENAGPKLQEEIKINFGKRIEYQDEYKGKELTTNFFDKELNKDFSTLIAEINQKIRTRNLLKQEEKSTITQLKEKTPKYQQEFEKEKFTLTKSYKNIKKRVNKLEKKDSYLSNKLDKFGGYLSENYGISALLKKGTNSIIGTALETVNFMWDEVKPNNFNNMRIPTDKVIEKLNQAYKIGGEEYKEIKKSFLKNIPGVPEEYIEKMGMSKEELKKYEEEKEKEKITLDIFSLFNEKNLLIKEKDLFNSILSEENNNFIDEIINELLKEEPNLNKYKPKKMTQILWEQKIKEAKLNLNKRVYEKMLSNKTPKKERKKEIRELFKKLVVNNEKKSKDFFEQLSLSKNPKEFLNNNNLNLTLENSKNLKTFINIITGGDQSIDKIDEHQINDLVSMLEVNPYQVKLPIENIKDFILKEENVYEKKIKLLKYKKTNNKAQNLDLDKILEYYDLKIKEKQIPKKFTESEINQYEKILEELGNKTLSNRELRDFENLNFNEEERKLYKSLFKRKEKEKVAQSEIIHILEKDINRNLEKLIKLENISGKEPSVTRNLEENIIRVLSTPQDLNKRQEELQKLVNVIIDKIETQRTTNESNKLEEKRQKELEGKLSLEKVINRLELIENFENIFVVELGIKKEVIEQIVQRVKIGNKIDNTVINNILSNLKVELIKEKAEDNPGKIEEVLRKVIKENKSSIEKKSNISNIL